MIQLCCNPSKDTKSEGAIRELGALSIGQTPIFKVICVAFAVLFLATAIAIGGCGQQIVPSLFLTTKSLLFATGACLGLSFLSIAVLATCSCRQEKQHLNISPPVEVQEDETPPVLPLEDPTEVCTFPKVSLTPVSPSEPSFVVSRENRYEIPYDVALIIASFLTANDLASCVTVSKDWYRVFNSESMWGQLCEIVLGHKPDANSKEYYFKHRDLAFIHLANNNKLTCLKIIECRENIENYWVGKNEIFAEINVLETLANLRREPGWIGGDPEEGDEGERGIIGTEFVIIDPKTGEIQSLPIIEAKPSTISYFDLLDNNFIVGCCSGKLMSMASPLSDPPKVTNFVGHQAQITSAAVNKSKNLLFSGSLDRTIRMWNPNTGENLRTFGEGILKKWDSVHLRTNGDGTRIVSASNSGEMRIWDCESGQCLHILDKGIHSSLNELYVSNNTILSSNMGRITMWDFMTGDRVMSWNNGNSFINFVNDKVFFSDAWKVCIGDLKGNCIRFSNNDTNRCWISSMKVTGEVAVTGSCDGTIRVWDLREWKEKAQCLCLLKEGEGEILDLKIVGDKIIAAVGNKITIWGSK